MYDAIIVGQGLAGTSLAWKYILQGKHVLVIDDDHRHASTAVGAGIVNPLTGRKFILAWNYPAFASVAKPFYAKLEAVLGLKLIHDFPILRAVHDVATQNELDIRLSDAIYSNYINPTPNWDEYRTCVNESIDTVGIKNGFRVDITTFMTASAKRFETEDVLMRSKFDHSEVRFEDDRVVYKDFTAKYVIFCEGAGAVDNPYFNYLPFNLSKGEVLHLRIPNLPSNCMYKNKVFFVPLYDEVFWVGSADAWKFDDDHPTDVGRARLLEKVEAVLKIPYKVVDHHAAVRPTVKHRKPMLGKHPKWSNAFILNGLGTKGALLAPAMTNMLFEHIDQGKKLMEEVDIQQFESLFAG